MSFIGLLTIACLVVLVILLIVNYVNAVWLEPDWGIEQDRKEESDRDLQIQQREHLSNTTQVRGSKDDSGREGQ